MFEKYRVIHFVGIGGIGMSGIAEVLFNLGYEVKGSDLRETETTKRLGAMGIKVYIGHRAENIGTAHVVVISSAVSDDNPEVVEASIHSVPVIPRAEMLAELGRLKYSILVAGAHGKTTTTSLISTVLGKGGFDPTSIIGGRLKGIGSNAKLGEGQFLVAEADESDGSFLKLSPTLAVVTNIDREHMDYFKDMKSLKHAFLSFINKIPFYGVAFVCWENETLRELIPSIHRRFITYGLSDETDIHAANIERGFMTTSFDVIYKKDLIGRFSLPMPGIHNVLNALACIGVARELKMDVQAISEALKSFSGIQRRFEFKGEARGIKVYDDYGHHPTEIMATLAAGRENRKYLKKKGRLFVIFQPHRYTRTADLMDEFAGSFGDADILVLLDIYPAGEKPIEGITSDVLAEKIELEKHCEVVRTDKEGAVEYVVSEMKKGDILLTLGAGDVWRLGETALERLYAD
ncbi:MAG: UDP-N-acetylmuramate--L-alanine ligase [Nitrospira bacterium HGW-Nitrospira-1]|nr:MAG: UDP-N-acetylmuramate--L-alanine ligase [Nitrospira bacterium HGW-Nitrospira-1]